MDIVDSVHRYQEFEETLVEGGKSKSLKGLLNLLNLIIKKEVLTNYTKAKSI